MKCQICNNKMEGRVQLTIPGVTIKICEGCLKDIEKGRKNSLIRKLGYKEGEDD